MKSGKRAKACDIPQKVKGIVWERDCHRCVICGMYGYAKPEAHYISRQNGGLGIPENIFTVCTNLSPNQCHRRYDSGAAWERDEIRETLRRHFRKHYPEWDEEKLVYKKR